MSYIGNRHSLSFGSEARLASAIPKFRRNLNEISANGTFGCIQGARAETTKNGNPGSTGGLPVWRFCPGFRQTPQQQHLINWPLLGPGSSGGP